MSASPKGYGFGVPSPSTIAAGFYLIVPDGSLAFSDPGAIHDVVVNAPGDLSVQLTAAATIIAPQMFIGSLLSAVDPPVPTTAPVFGSVGPVVPGGSAFRVVFDPTDVAFVAVWRMVHPDLNFETWTP